MGPFSSDLGVSSLRCSIKSLSNKIAIFIIRTCDRSRGAHRIIDKYKWRGHIHVHN